MLHDGCARCAGWRSLKRTAGFDAVGVTVDDRRWRASGTGVQLASHIQLHMDQYSHLPHTVLATTNGQGCATPRRAGRFRQFAGSSAAIRVQRR